MVGISGLQMCQVIPVLSDVLTAAAEVLEQDSMRTTTQAANADGLGLRYIAFNHGFLLGLLVDLLVKIRGALA